MKGIFRQVSPAVLGEKASLPMGWMVVSSRWVESRLERRRAHARWYRVKSAEGECFRVLRFSPNLKGSAHQSSGDLVIDWAAWLQLNGYPEDVPETADLEISRARWWQLGRLAAAHPDPAIRLSSILGLVSVVLGLLSLTLAVAPL